MSDISGKIKNKFPENTATFTVRVYFDRGMNFDGGKIKVIIRRLSHMPGAVRGPWQEIASAPLKRPRISLLGYTTVRIPVPLETLSYFGQYNVTVGDCEYEARPRLNTPDSPCDYWDGGLTDKKIYLELC